ncbi:MAG: DoxX family membrane protein [Bacteroidetes bacterium]|nr:MAG: DoxX family membrane protein [Bacteroidota bacterium]
MELLEPIPFLRSLVLAFLAILFLQSGLDKVFNYRGNLEWLTGHFAKSPLKNTVGLLLPVITVLEVGAGALSAIGLGDFMISGDPAVGLWGARLAALAVLSLFFGQRLAQDYAGAATLVPYFLTCLAAIYLLA